VLKMKSFLISVYFSTSSHGANDSTLLSASHKGNIQSLQMIGASFYTYVFKPNELS